MSGIIKLTTAGSVDDGKSTLLGRLFLDSGKIPTDVLEKLNRNSLNLANLSDGLKEEQEHSITIDVGYRYFELNNSKFILADSPGHDEYTPKFISALTQVDCCLILIDVAEGVKPQTIRHLELARFLKVKKICFLINKMDLVQYHEGPYHLIKNSLKLHDEDMIIPVSSLWGDNVVHKTDSMKWYTGPTLLTWLTNLETFENTYADLQLESQFLTPDGLNLGKLREGTLDKGERVSDIYGNENSIIELWHFGTEVENVEAPLSIAFKTLKPLSVPTLIFKVTSSLPKANWFLNWFMFTNDKFENLPPCHIRIFSLELPFQFSSLKNEDLNDQILSCEIFFKKPLTFPHDCSLKVTIVNTESREVIGLGFLS